MDVLEQVKETIERYDLVIPGELLILGVSGGPDSLCMLHVFRRLAPDYDLRLHVGHLDHGIRGQEAEEDAAFVQRLCQEWGVPCTVQREDVPALAQERGIALEEAARQARYRFLGELARSLGARAVAVAHNADDQVETVLMHFLRGAGLAGLRGMSPVAWMDELRVGEEQPRLGRIRLLRPLLEVPREAIEAYCREQGLEPRFDRSNLDTTYFRNRLRHELIPYLESYNPNIREVVRRMAQVLAGDYELLRQLLAETWPQVVRQEDEEAIVFDLEALRALPVGLQRSVLREAVHRLRFSLRNINWVHIEDALQVLRKGKVGSQATLPQGLMLTLGYREAVLASEGYQPPLGDERPRIQKPLLLEVPGETILPGGAWLVVTQILGREALCEGWEQNADPYRAYLDADRVGRELYLRPRTEGDWFVPLGLEGRKKLSDFMINAKIPRQERSQVPLLLSDGEIAWVVGWRVDARYAVSPGTKRVLVVQFKRKEGKR